MVLSLHLFLPDLNAQLPDYHLQLYDHNSGIRPGAINKVARDSKGYVWISYPRQVQRFDGKNAEIFRIDGWVSGLFCDDEGNVWLNTPEKILKFNEDRRAFSEVRVNSAKNNTYGISVFQTPDKNLWLLSNQSLYKYDRTNEQFHASSHLPILPPYSVRIFAQDGWTIFLAHASNIYSFNLLNGKKDSLVNQSAMAMHAISADSLLVSTWDGTTYWYDFPRKRLTQVYSPEPLQDEPVNFFSVRSLAPFEPGRFFLVTNTGIYEYNHLTRVFKRLKFFLNGRKVATNDYVRHISLDNEGYAWMASIDGIARFLYKQQQAIGLIRVRQANDEIPVAIDNVRKIVEDNEGNLWLATGHGFASWNRTKEDWDIYLSSHAREDRLSFPSIRGMVFDGRYLILGPANLGIWLFDTKSRKYRRPSYASEETKEKDRGDFVDDIHTLRNGNHLVMGRDAVYLLDGKSYQLRILDIPAGKENSNYGFQGRDGIIWITTGKGLHCLDSNLNQLENVRLPPKATFISAGFMFPDSRLLFSTAEGLFTAEYIQGKAVVKKFTALLDDVFVLTLYQDDNGFVWATSEDGIYRLDPARSKLDLFDYSDNVQGYGFNGNSWFKTRQGYLFFGGVNGINYLKPELVSTVNDKLRVYIKQVKIGTDSLVYTFSRSPHIRFSQRALEVSFVSPYFNNPDKVKYRYKLEGLDNEWKYLGNTNQVRFSSLSPGNYKLTIEASLNNVDWIKGENDFRFRIQPPFWLTWWFVTICAVALVGSIGLIVKNRSKKLRAKEEELEREQAVNYFASSLYQHQSVEAILWDVARNCIGRLQFEHCVIYMLDAEKKVLKQTAAYGPKSPGEYELLRPLEIPLGMGITGSAALKAKAEIIQDTTRDNRYIVDGERRHSEIAVPIVFGERVLGVIDCEHSKKRFFTQKHLSVLTTIASLCANKIVRVQAEEERVKAERVVVEAKQKMAEAEMQALRAQMNPHFIFNCLNSINRYIVKSDHKTASLYLTRFAKLIRLILDNSNNKSVTLANELEALKLYIEMESIRFEKKFTYMLQVDESIQQDNIYVPPLIIQPYVENAIWHGLLHKETEGELRIHISHKRPGLLECVIEDNGVGREKAKELKSKSASQKKSLGMRLTEDRLALLSSGEVLMSGAIEVEDLKTDEGAAIGTKVILRIPIDN